MNLKEFRRLASVISFATFLLSLPLPMRADALDNWTTYQLSTNNYYLNQITYGSGHYVAVGYSCSDFGVVFTSENGRHWTLSANGCVSQAPLILLGVTHGEQTFVGVGFYSTIYSSSNGIEWVYRMSGPFYNFTSVTYGDGLLVAVGDGALFSGGVTRTNIYTSPDAITWTPQVSVSPPEEPESIWDIAFGAGRFVAVGGGGYCYTSTDGSNWSRNQIASGDLSRSSFCNGLFFVPYGPGVNLVSADGLAWLSLTNDTQFVFREIAYDRGLYVTFGYSITLNASAILSSTNGTNWVQRQVLPRTWGDYRSLVMSDREVVVLGTVASGKPVALVSDPFVGISLIASVPRQIEITGLVGRSYRVEYLPSLPASGTNSWQTLTNLILSSSPYLLEDPEAPSSMQRYYRAVLLP